MALEGTLEDFSLADIFQLIGIQRKTGILSLRRAEESVTVKFHNGLVIGADSSPKKLEDRIGKVLVKTQLITQDQLKEALEHQQRTLQKIGFILVDQNYITREQLKEALQIQVAQMIYRLFRWHSGEYYFDQKARVDTEADENIPPMSAESILMEGIQMIDEWPIIEKRIPNFNMVFRPTVGPEDLDLGDLDEDADFDTAFSRAGNSSGEASDKIRLSRDEAEVFMLVNGKSSVAEIIESSRMGEFHTCKALYDLLERKIVESGAPTRQAPFQPSATASVFTAAESAESSRKSGTPLFYGILAIIVFGLIVINVKDPLKLAIVPFFSDAGETQLKRTASLGRINQVDAAVLLYYYANGKLPDTLEDLASGNCLKPEYLRDSWHRPYAYQVQGSAYILSGHTEKGELDEGVQVTRTLRAPQPIQPPPPLKK